MEEAILFIILRKESNETSVGSLHQKTSHNQTKCWPGNKYTQQTSEKLNIHDALVHK